MYPPSVVKYEVKICLQRAVNAPTPHLISFTCTPIWNESLLTHFQKETSLSKVPADIWTGNHVQINFGSWNHSVANLDQVQATLVTYVIRDFPGMYWHGPLFSDVVRCAEMCGLAVIEHLSKNFTDSPILANIGCTENESDPFTA